MFTRTRPPLYIYIARILPRICPSRPLATLTAPARLHPFRCSLIVTYFPAARQTRSRFYRYVEPPRIIRGSQSSGPRATFSAARNPIITVTEHTPTPSPDYMRRQGSFDSQLDALSTTGSAAGAFRVTQMLRSHTDSHIDYSGADESEAPGSSFYITREGGLDYEIVLLAVYTVFKRDSALCSLRVLETGLNICELLIDLGVMKLGEHAHNLSMGIAKRTLLHLGCPHGCNDGRLWIDMLLILSSNIYCMRETEVKE